MSTHDKQQETTFYEELQKWNRTTNQWKNSQKHLFTYENGQQTSVIYQPFDKDLNKFVNATKTNYLFSADGKEIETIHYSWTSESWFKFETERTIYNDKEQLIESSNFYWSLEGGYEYSYSTINAYDENDHILSSVFSKTLNGDIAKIDSTHYEWVLLKKGATLNNNLISLYPNPTSSYFFVKTDLSLTNAIVKVYLPTGQLNTNSTSLCPSTGYFPFKK